MNIEKIAKLAGVSKSAVSLALNGKTGVSEQTREIVLKIAKEVGYKHKSMLEKKNKVVVRFLVVTDTSFVQQQYATKPFFNELIQHLQQQCAKQDCEMILSSISIQSVINHQITYTEEDQDGVILLGTNLCVKEIQIIKDHFKRVVVLDTLIDELPVDFVVMNNKMGVYQAIEHLRMLGHLKIGYIQSAERINNLDVRYESFKQALHNYRCEEDFLTFSLSSNYIRSDESFQQWFTSLPVNKRPSAFFCENDYLAISVLKSINAIDSNLTQTVSVVGFDNISEAVVITPELTTIHVDKEQMAITAIRRLKAIIEEDEVSVKVMIDTKLMTRNSTRKAKDSL